jgi:hypothetical protein
LTEFLELSSGLMTTVLDLSQQLPGTRTLELMFWLQLIRTGFVSLAMLRIQEKPFQLFRRPAGCS